LGADATGVPARKLVNRILQQPNPIVLPSARAYVLVRMGTARPAYM
jgi:hypothetical protein